MLASSCLLDQIDSTQDSHRVKGQAQQASEASPGVRKKRGQTRTLPTFRSTFTRGTKKTRTAFGTAPTQPSILCTPAAALDSEARRA